jgi:hypothetical protein
VPTPKPARQKAGAAAAAAVVRPAGVAKTEDRGEKTEDRVNVRLDVRMNVAFECHMNVNMNVCECPFECLAGGEGRGGGYSEWQA